MPTGQGWRRGCSPGYLGWLLASAAPAGGQKRSTQTFQCAGRQAGRRQRLGTRPALCSLWKPRRRSAPRPVRPSSRVAGLAKTSPDGALTKIKLDNAGIVSVLYEQARAPRPAPRSSQPGPPAPAPVHLPDFH